MKQTSAYRVIWFEVSVQFFVYVGDIVPWDSIPGKSHRHNLQPHPSRSSHKWPGASCNNKHNKFTLKGMNIQEAIKGKQATFSLAPSTILLKRQSRRREGPQHFKCSLARDPVPRFHHVPTFQTLRLRRFASRRCLR